MNSYMPLSSVVVQHLPAAVALFDAQDLRLLLANPRFSVFLDPPWRDGKAIGHPLTEWFPQAEALGLVALCRTVAATGVPHRASENPFVGPECHGDSWLWILDPIMDDSGHCMHLISTISAITGTSLPGQQASSQLGPAQNESQTERQRLQMIEAEVEQDRTHLHIVLDQLPDGVLIAEPSTGNITYANALAAHILGVPSASLVGHPFQAHPRTIGSKQWRGHSTFPWNYAIIRAFCGETVNSLETVVTRPDGSHVFTLCSCTPLRTANGDITEAVLVFQDITERMSLEQHKNSFLSMASHELRTPVTAIQGFAELLQYVAAQGQGLSDPAAFRALANIVTQSELLSHLIEEMLDLSRIEQAYLSLNYASHDLIQMLTSLVETMAPTSHRHHLHLVLEGRQTTDQLLGWFDERRVMQVLSNLVSNAIKYSPAGGEIEVGLRWTPERPDEALLWVRDKGIGIAKAEIPLIFKRFYRVSTLDPSMSGLGIGLYLVKDLITRHGGRIWVKSAEGKGSTFFVVLPLSHERDKGTGQK